MPVSGAASFRMIAGTKLAMALAGGSLALSRFEGHHFIATVFGGLAGVIAMFGLLSYLTDIHTLYGLASVRLPALPTAVGVLCVASAILLRIGRMPVLRKPRALWHLLIMLGAAIIAPLLLFGFNVAVSVANTQLDQVRNELMSEARSFSAEIDREIAGEIELLQALAASPSSSARPRPRWPCAKAATSCSSIAACGSSSIPGCPSVRPCQDRRFRKL